MPPINHPSQIVWIEGELPDVHTVPYNSTVLVWLVYHEAEQILSVEGGFSRPVPAPELDGKLKLITIAQPWKDDLNPLRWYAGSTGIGFQEKVKYYAWIHKPIETIECPDCDGFGYIDIDGGNGGDDLCWHCDGTGKIKNI
jgi:hypothetical protein